MKTLEQQLSGYAAYHRDRRNIATHFVGIPMIVFGVAALLSRPVLAVAGGVPLSAALVVTLGAMVFYLALDVRYGIAMAAFMGAAWWTGAEVATHSTALWLTFGIGLFVAGWAIQFVGHAFEGRKPAFVDDVVGLLVGPLFIVAEAGFALGLRNGLHEAIVQQVGPTLIRSAAASASVR
ncbi:MAG: rane protein [Myxococcales bacterium]|nr:rane protein [Myxococcales bacterium]